MRRCIDCKDEKMFSEFHFRNKSKGQYQSVCKECKKKRHAKNYQDNQIAWKKRIKERRSEVRKYIQDVKEASPCCDCQKFYPYYVMDFDHLDNKTKEVSRMVSFGLDKVKKEIEKCDLVCSNCHRERTHMRP